MQLTASGFLQPCDTAVGIEIALHKAKHRVCVELQMRLIQPPRGTNYFSSRVRLNNVSCTKTTGPRTVYNTHYIYRY